MQFGGLEGEAAQAQWGAGGYLGKVDRAVGSDDGGCGVAGAGQRGAAGDGIVDRVDAGGADFPGGVCIGVAGRRAFLEVETDDDVVEAGE